ncbi:hypothetical protein LCM20_14120 [Halobacillus litoralis]|uniref:SCP2 sterol-binding domain-containing protein n=1 Tax=Halobacillus litoralis TaxID=45668 RepID=UPI001CD7F05F|nr:hypothetical protein [Halobacillus litoralis]MCA0971739.1 hypothetical protein [Halobacillus litoralis]
MEHDFKKWAAGVNRRRDLYPLMRGVSFMIDNPEDPSAYVFTFSKTGVEVSDASDQEMTDVTLEAPSHLIEKLFRGEEKLTTLRAENSTLKGSLAHLLQVEALIYLSK